MMGRIATTIALSALAGCSTHKSVINSAFDDLVNETRSTNSHFMNYKSFVSISGLVPHAAPGSLFHHPDGLSPTHGLGLSPKWSYVVESTFPMAPGKASSGFDKIKAIRDKYVEAREAIVKATALQVTSALVDRALELARSSNDLEQCRLAARILGTVEPKERCSDADQKALDTARIDVNAKAAKAMATAAEKRDELVKAVDQPNILVTRWDQGTELTFLGKLAEFLSISIDRKKEMGGVLIAGDLRTWSVKVGEDYVDMVREMDPNARPLFEQVGIDLFLIHAKYRMYVAELRLEDAVAASLSLTVEQLRNLRTALGAGDRIELGLGAAMLSDISNIGALSAPDHKIRRRCFFPPTENEAAAQRETLLAQSYHPVYEVRGQMTRLKELGSIETDLSRQLSRNDEKVRKDAIINSYKACANARVDAVKP